MMRIVEKSSDYLRLSNADTSWSKWGFVFAIVALLLSGMFIAVKVMRPACWSGFFLGSLLLFLLIRELPRSFDTEFQFDRKSDQLTVIKRPWLGRPSVEHYSLSDITEVKVVLRPQNTHNYPGHDYDDAETESPVESPKYDVEVVLRSGNILEIYEAPHLATSIVEFLGLTLATT